MTPIVARRRARRVRRKRRGRRRRRIHWNPAMRSLHKRLSGRRIYNPATGRRISLWSFRYPLTPAMAKRIGRTRARMYVRFHKKFKQVAHKLLRNVKRKPKLLTGRSS